MCAPPSEGIAALMRSGTGVPGVNPGRCGRCAGFASERRLMVVNEGARQGGSSHLVFRACRQLYVVFLRGKQRPALRRAHIG